MTTLPPRLNLAQLPTPFHPLDRLSEAWGGPRIWVKRDDLTGFGVTGNKIRKLEFHLAAARLAGADTLITCGAAQSNHCRTTALAAAGEGFAVHLLLRTTDGKPPEWLTGNHLLDRLAGATIDWITPDQYLDRDELMEQAAEDLSARGAHPWIIPEGASDALGMWGFVAAFRELEQQLVMMGSCAAVWHAASSGGTTAGLGWAADRLGVRVPIIGSSVDLAVPDLRKRIDVIWEAAVVAHGGSLPQPDLELTDDHVGLGYGLTTAEELRTQMQVTALTGLVLDPTYTGKAAHGLYRDIQLGRFTDGDNVVFWHTGGGFAVFSHDFGDVLDA